MIKHTSSVYACMQAYPLRGGILSDHKTEDNSTRLMVICSALGNFNALKISIYTFY